MSRLKSSRASSSCAAGAWRAWQTTAWPDNDFVKRVQARIGDRMLFGQLRANDPTWHCWFTVIEGGFFAGTAHAITKFEAVYYEFHDNMTVSNATDHFLGKQIANDRKQAKIIHEYFG